LASRDFGHGGGIDAQLMEVRMTEYLTMVDDGNPLGSSRLWLRLVSWVLYPAALVLVDFHMKRSDVWCAAVTFGAYIVLRHALVAKYFRYYVHHFWTPDQAPLLITPIVGGLQDLALAGMLYAAVVIKAIGALVVIPMVLMNLGTEGLFVYITIVTGLFVITDIRRIADIVIAALPKRNQAALREAGHPLAVLVFSYVSIVLDYSFLWYALYSLYRPLFRGNFSESLAVDFFYFNVVTLATVGYGDVFPAHWISKLLVSFEVLLGYVLLAITLGTLTSILAFDVDAWTTVEKG
jgi:voltage-gated potassium channel Kch